MNIELRLTYSFTGKSLLFRKRKFEIRNLILVIDCGFVKLRWFNPETHTDSLVVVPISKASAEQRTGRAGRVRSGKAYR